MRITGPLALALLFVGFIQPEKSRAASEVRDPNTDYNNNMGPFLSLRGSKRPEVLPNRIDDILAEVVQSHELKSTSIARRFDDDMNLILEPAFADGNSPMQIKIGFAAQSALAYFDEHKRWPEDKPLKIVIVAENVNDADVQGLADIFKQQLKEAGAGATSAVKIKQLQDHMDIAADEMQIFVYKQPRRELEQEVVGTTSPTKPTSTKPTTKPTVMPTAMPTTKPTVMPTTKPTVMPTTKPTVMPTPKQTTSKPTAMASSSSPTTHASQSPTTTPTSTQTPSLAPAQPSSAPTPAPVQPIPIVEPGATGVTPAPSTAPALVCGPEFANANVAGDISTDPNSFGTANCVRINLSGISDGGELEFKFTTASGEAIDQTLQLSPSYKSGDTIYVEFLPQTTTRSTSGGVDKNPPAVNAVVYSNGQIINTITLATAGINDEFKTTFQLRAINATCTYTNEVPLGGGLNLTNIGNVLARFFTSVPGIATATTGAVLLACCARCCCMSQKELGGGQVAARRSSLSN